MPFYIRKSVRFGPLRFNLSKSGLGVSTGIKGARIGTGPRGTYIHLGRNGFYHRRRIGSRKPVRPPASPVLHSAPEETNTAQAADLLDSSAADMLAEINAHIHRFQWAPILVLSTLTVWIAFASAGSALSLPALIIGGLWAWIVGKQDRARRTMTISYVVDDSLKQHLFAVQSACDTLSGASNVWRIETRAQISDWKHHAGASSLVTHKRATVRRTSPPFISTNIEVWEIRIGESFQLLSFPDRLLVFQKGTYGGVPYGSLTVDVHETHFRESAPVPPDSKIIGHTW